MFVFAGDAEVELVFELLGLQGWLRSPCSSEVLGAQWWP